MSNVFNFPQKGLGLATGALPLAIGAQGAAVAELQEKLNQAKIIPTTSGGTFDASTEAAVKNFQNQANIPITGIVDANTWNALEFRGPAPTPRATSLTVQEQAAKKGPGARPLWQWGLLALGVVGGIALLLKMMESEKGGVSGLRRLLSDGEKTVGGGTTEKCARTPSDDKLVDAEIMEPS